MAYNTKPIVTDVDGNPISQYYNSTTNQYEPVEGSHGANKVILYNEDGTENNELSLIPILEKLSELTGTALDERTRQNNELQRIAFYDMLQQMLADGELKGDKGDKGDVGRGLEFDWQGTMLGIRVEGDLEFVYVDLIGPRGLPGTIENLDKIHIEEALGYTPVKSVNNVVADEIGNVELDIDTSEIENRIGNVEDDLAAHKADNAAHGATTSAIANRIVVRDESGGASFSHFGLSPARSTTDLNDRLRNGWSTVDSNTPNTPESGVQGILLTNMWDNNAASFQIFHAFNANSSYVRGRANNTWQPWMQLITSNIVQSGTGSPEGVVTASVGTLYRRTDGGAGATLYVKESGTGNTGWVAK